MNRKKITQDQHQGMPIIAFAIISQQDPDQDLFKNESDEDPEIPAEDDLGIQEEIDFEDESEFDDETIAEEDDLDIQEESGFEDESELDDETIAEDEEANDAEGLPFNRQQSHQM
ncbi:MULTISPECIES: hypothetical protein [unclassified Sphingobacterium]|uniref:hypothetical protein n=1 Tax=unclassified Sphingobacterium TaxID=2609468 RepID=UPI0025D2BFDF|nr:MULTISPECIES: hypothetical protein [unclassified Sphingobacterium]